MNMPLIRNSERNDFKSCPAKWNWRWNQGLVPAMARQDARWFGTIWHLVWAEYMTPPAGTEKNPKRGFIRGRDPHETWEQATKNAFVTIAAAPYFDDDKEKEFFDASELGHIMIDGHMNTYKGDPGFEVLMPEQRFSAKIPYTEDQILRGVNVGAPNQNFIVTAVGTFDLPIRDHTDDRGRIKILDWKTTNKSTNLKHLNKDDQTGTYISVATGFLRREELIRQDEAVEGMIFSFARKAKPPENVDANGIVRNKPTKAHYVEALGKFGITDKSTIAQCEALALSEGITVWGEPSKNQGSPLFWRESVTRNRANRLRQITRIAEDAEVINLVRNNKLPVIKTPGDHCNWCDFADLCDIDEDGGDTEDFIKAVYKYENPYADHEEGARNSKESVAANQETKSGGQV